MHPYISQTVNAQRIEEALTRAEASRRYALARATRRHTRSTNHHGLLRWIVRTA